MKIAIIGTGISGLGAAYLLNPHHEITVYERNDYIGGHSRTITVGDHKTPVDTGFIVFNYRNYPHLTGMFKHLNVPVEKSDMSFGASIANGWLEYGSKGMFAQKRNALRPAYWKMLADILRFNKKAEAFLERSPDLTLAECLDELKMGEWFRRYYLQAMGAAIWSCSVDTIEQFPARTFIRFFKNHGLLTVKGHPQWYTVTGGSRQYVKRLTASFADKIRLNCAAITVVRDEKSLQVYDSQGGVSTYDHVIFACHADQALKILGKPSAKEKEILGAFTYQKNSVVVHRDLSFMPKRRKAWASWVYLSESTKDKKDVVSLSYWMNNLQNLDPATPIIVTLNPGRVPRADLVMDRHDFSHPVFTREAVNAQGRIDEIQGQKNTWYCGAYQRYGFHEDGLLSAVRLVEKFGITPPWN